MRLDLMDMRLLVRIAECNSVTRGAQAAHMSVPAASSRVKALEEGIGARLLDRTSHGVTLTPAGQAFVQNARIVLSQIERLSNDLQAYAKGLKGRLRVFANTTALCEFLPDVLRAYLKTHRSIDVDLRERSSHDIVRAVSARQIDIGIVAGPIGTQGLETIPYRTDRLVLVVPTGHALATRDSVHFEEALGYDHVRLHEASAIHGFLERICDSLHSRLKVRIEVGSFEAACRMVESTVGIGVMPGGAARRHARTMDIRLVALVDEWAHRDLRICVRSLDALPAFARDLIEMLIADSRASHADSAEKSLDALDRAQAPYEVDYPAHLDLGRAAAVASEP